MKNFRLTLAIFILTATFLASSCGSPVEENPDALITLTAEDFQINTLQAEVGETAVMLRGSFNVDPDKITTELKWGFLWRLSREDDSLLRRIVVGRGHEGTAFALNKDDFPKGVELMVCAFVEAQLTENAEITRMPGEEVFFDF